MIFKLLQERTINDEQFGGQRAAVAVMEDTILTRLEESGWNDQMKELATQIARKQGVHKATK